jgi:hypothetical protein
VLRGYDARDRGRQPKGGEPGTLYVMELTSSGRREIADGEAINPTAWTPRPCFASSSRSAHGRPRRGCGTSRPTSATWPGLSEQVQGVLDRAVELAVETVDELRGSAMATGAG